VQVRATNEKLGYHVQGELTMRFKRDEATGEVIGAIPSLGLVGQGVDEESAREDLYGVFAEFCDVAAESPRGLLPALVARGFTISQVIGGKTGPRAPQYLEITWLDQGADADDEPRTIAVGSEKEELVEAGS
jgi:hypothetical protein